jgi:uncharacterized protein
LKPALRQVLDTNVVLSALLWEGRPPELLDLGATDRIRQYTSAALLNGLERSLAKPHLAKRLAATGLTPQQHATNYASMAVLVVAEALLKPVSRDSDDDCVLACAIAAEPHPASTSLTIPPISEPSTNT